VEYPVLYRPIVCVGLGVQDFDQPLDGYSLPIPECLGEGFEWQLASAGALRIPHASKHGSAEGFVAEQVVIDFLEIVGEWKVADVVKKRGDNRRSDIAGVDNLSKEWTEGVVIKAENEAARVVERAETMFEA